MQRCLQIDRLKPAEGAAVRRPSPIIDSLEKTFIRRRHRCEMPAATSAMAAMALSDRSGGRPHFLGVGDDTIAYIVRLQADDRCLCTGVVDGAAKL